MAIPAPSLIDADVEVVDEKDLPTLTYYLDPDTLKIVSLVDENKAMGQAIKLRLETVRAAHAIFSDDYGLESMIGLPMSYVRADLPRRIKDAILQDARVTDVTNIVLDGDKDEMHVSLVAHTIYGNVTLLKERLI